MDKMKPIPKAPRRRISVEKCSDEIAKAMTEVETRYKTAAAQAVLDEIVKIHRNGYFNAAGELYAERTIARLTDENNKH